jgi:hypothetical protein
VDEEALLKREVRVRLEAAAIRISDQVLSAQPPDSVARVDRIANGKIYVRTSLTKVGGVAEIVPKVTTQGRLRLEIVSFRGQGLLSIVPIPPATVAWAIRQAFPTHIRPKLPPFLPADPALYFGADNQIEIDLTALAESAGLTLAPLKAAAAGEGVLELAF